MPPELKDLKIERRYMTRHDPAEVVSRLDVERVYRSKIDCFKPVRPGQAIGICPWHDDKRASLSIDTIRGLFNCFSCSASGDIYTFWQKINGVSFREAITEFARQAGMEPPISSKVTATFYYTDESGKPLYRKKRIEPGRSGRSKDFVFYHGKNDPGRGCDSVLYRLHQVSKAKAVIIVEGEAKADLLVSWGLAATCLDAGAQSKLTDKQAAHLEGKRICILPDNDDAGKIYADNIVAKLRGKVTLLRVVSLPGLPPKGDIIDWAGMSENNNRASLIALIRGEDKDVGYKIEQLALAYRALSAEDKEIVRRSWQTTRSTMRSTALAT